MRFPTPHLLPALLALLVVGGCGGAGYATYGADVGYVEDPVVEPPC